jgi:hypothetical protein
VCEEGKAGESGQPLLTKRLPTATLPAEVMTRLAPFAPPLSLRVLPMPTRHLAGPTAKALFPVPFWDGECNRVIALATGLAVRYHSGLPPVARRWVLSREPQDTIPPQALLYTDPSATPVTLLPVALGSRWTTHPARTGRSPGTDPMLWAYQSPAKRCAGTE